MAANLENPAVATELEKSVFIPVPKKESNALGQSPGDFYIQCLDIIQVKDALVWLLSQ